MWGAIIAAIPAVMELIQGMSHSSSSPYDAAGKSYGETLGQYLPDIKGNLTPYTGAGQNALNNWQSQLAQMQNPQNYVSNIMSGYSQSPYASFLSKYGNQGINNAASASGMLGSGALMKAAADYNQDLTSKDMQTYLGNVLGVNQEYLGGQQALSGMGLAAGSTLSDLLTRIAMGHADVASGAAFGSQAGQGMDLGNIMSGGSSLLKQFSTGGKNGQPGFGGFSF